jgi:hypothetical protein
MEGLLAEKLYEPRGLKGEKYEGAGEVGCDASADIYSGGAVAGDAIALVLLWPPWTPIPVAGLLRPLDNEAKSVTGEPTRRSG